jgi:HEAT repeat protein
MQEMVPDIVKVLRDEKVHPAARQAAAHALIGLDSRGSAAALFEASQKGDKDLRAVVEPALAQWKFEPIRPVWRLRIASNRTPRRDLILAINGLGVQRDSESLDALLGLAMNGEQAADIRLSTARAAGKIADSGLEPKAEQLIRRTPATTLDKLCAGALIASHGSEHSISLRQILGKDPEPSVASESLTSLFAIDPQHVIPLIEGSLLSADSNIRRVGIETVLRLPSEERVRLLGPLLSDPHPKLRGMVRDGFRDLAQDKAFDALVRQLSVTALHGDDWRGQEQAALVVGALDEESAAPRLIELLKSPRPEVNITVAWSLAMLGIPETSQPVFDFIVQRTESKDPVTIQSDNQLAHLFDLLGVLKMADAVPVMEKYIPKASGYGVNSRASAIWALGVIQEGRENEPLAKRLIERVLDTMSSPPEMYQVRRASVLTLGRLRAKSQVATLKVVIGLQVDSNPLELSMRLAIHQITGEWLPIGAPQNIERTGWFLEPSLRVE